MVGLYAVGDEVGGLASSELLDPITRALFAGFASARRSGEGIAKAYLRAISLVALVMLPASAGIALIARPMMHLVFGPRWDAAILLVQVFACVGVFRVGASISATLLTAEGVPQIGFRIEAVLTILRVVGLLALVPVFGLIGAAAAAAAAGLIEEAIYLVVTFRRVGLRPRDLALNLWRPALATAAMALVLLAMGLTEPLAGAGFARSGGMLGASVLAGALVYGATLLVAWIASGRPHGAETYFLAAASQAIRYRFGH
jgi:PST family polysaccharide transporter